MSTSAKALLKRVLRFYAAGFRAAALIIGVGSALLFVAFSWRLVADGYVTIDGRRSSDPRDVAWVLGFLLTPDLTGIGIFLLMPRNRDP